MKPSLVAQFNAEHPNLIELIINESGKQTDVSVIGRLVLEGLVLTADNLLLAINLKLGPHKVHRLLNYASEKVKGQLRTSSLDVIGKVIELCGSLHIDRKRDLEAWKFDEFELFKSLQAMAAMAVRRYATRTELNDVTCEVVFPQQVLDYFKFKHVQFEPRHAVTTEEHADGTTTKNAGVTKLRQLLGIGNFDNRYKQPS